MHINRLPFDEPRVHDVATTSPTGQTLPPYQGSSPQTRHASRSGALVALKSQLSQKARILVLLLDRGPSCDGDLALWMGLPDGRVSSRRGALVTDGLVQHVDIVQGAHGAEVNRWELTVRGQNVAARLRAEQ
jgi:hypothetical protein